MHSAIFWYDKVVETTFSNTIFTQKSVRINLKIILDLFLLLDSILLMSAFYTNQCNDVIQSIVWYFVAGYIIGGPVTWATCHHWERRWRQYGGLPVQEDNQRLQVMGQVGVIVVPYSPPDCDVCGAVRRCVPPECVFITVLFVQRFLHYFYKFFPFEVEDWSNNHYKYQYWMMLNLQNCGFSPYFCLYIIVW